MSVKTFHKSPRCSDSRTSESNLPTTKQKNNQFLYRQNCCIPPTRQLQQCRSQMMWRKEKGMTQIQISEKSRTASCVMNRRIIKKCVVRKAQIAILIHSSTPTRYIRKIYLCEENDANLERQETLRKRSLLEINRLHFLPSKQAKHEQRLKSKHRQVSQSVIGHRSDLDLSSLL